MQNTLHARQPVGHVKLESTQPHGDCIGSSWMQLSMHGPASGARASPTAASPGPAWCVQLAPRPSTAPPPSNVNASTAGSFIAPS